MSGRRCGYRPGGGTGGRGPTQPPARAHHVAVERVEAAVAKAQRDLLDAGEHVSAWKVSQSAAEALQFDSWGAVGLRFYDVPALRTLQSIEAKINAFIHCFVCVRKMTSVHELETEVCRNEGVEKFEELGLGPLLRHPLVQHYFSVPPDAKEVCKITTEDLVGRLNVFLYRCKHKEVVVEEFLDFLVQRHSAQSKEALGVRIQSLGLCIKFIKGVRRMESAALKHVEESGSLIKEAPERTSSVFLDHLKSFSSWFGDDNDDGQCSSSAQVGKGMKRCKIRGKNALIVEETKFPGQKLAMSNDLGNDETVREEGVRSHELIQTVPKKVEKLDLKDEDLKKFITTWMGACQNHSVAEVLATMLHMYVSSDKRKRKMQKLFLSYPAKGLLNVAVRVIKCGTMGNILKDIDVQKSLSPCSIVDTESAGHSPATEVDSELCDDKCMEKDEHRVSVKDIIKQIANYVELVHLVPGKIDLPLVKQLVLRDCEMQLRTQFSVKDFQSLGYGTFFEFLEKFASQLPNQLHYLLTGESSSQSYLEVSILQNQLLVLLSQAARNLGIGNDLTKQFISFVLKQQFPTISFEIMGSEPVKGFLNLTKSQENCEVFCSVLFSAALFGNCCRKKLKSHIEQFSAESSQMIAERDQMTYTHSSVACKDAIECLLKAPMLSDLQSWSHWDLIFAPSLGPLLEWLLNVGSIKELSCVVTSEGRIIRIDQLASIDEFFEATIQGSSFKAAVKLLSLFCVYRGSNNVPLSLLTCYAQRAIDVRIRNFVDHLHADATKEIVANRSSLAGQCMLDKDDSLAVLADPSSTIAGSDEDRKIYEDLCRVKKAYSAVATFILECLGHLPSEFRSFAADILVMGMRSFTRDATKFILLESNHISQRIMLHEIGLSLGIVEWIDDYYAFSLGTAVDLFMPSGALSRTSEPFCPGIGMHSTSRPNVSTNIVFSDDGKKVDTEGHAKMQTEQQMMCHEGNERSSEDLSKKSNESLESVISRDPGILDANLLIESIRLEEFGLDSGQKETESILLQKQHARLGRALHCLAEELYSKDSHFLLELVQNADDNSYAESVEPTLVFILQHNGITILNNEKGFYAQNIRALCDVGSSTKKGSSAGYIGKKGIGFKSVFRVTDAPEIHSNGFHVKFDISDGQIGFVLPTVIPPCDIKLFQRQLSFEYDQTDSTSWNTCIILPFKPKLKKGTSMSSIVSMFSDLHPSLLLFLHRLRCIKFKNAIDDKLIIMRRENLRDGIVMVSHAKEKMSWLVVSQNLQASTIRPDVETTKISIAFPLKEIDRGNYIAHLEQQPAFAFLPLRKYGLKFILQGDFVLPSSREEVDGDNAWNQWLLSEFPDLFVSAEKSFCGLACFQESPAKAVTAYMSYVPLVGEVYGFFSQLPCMIISKLRTSNCLLLDDPNVEWVPPSRVLRGWDEEARIVLSVDLLQCHLGLGYLSRDIILPDSLAKALGIKEYGPKVLVEILSSICQFGDNMKSVSLDWLSSWLNALYTTLLVHSSGYLASENIGTESDVISNLKEISFIPLSDGSYGSVAKGPIWLPCDAFSSRFEGGNGLEHFPCLYAKLQTVNPLLFSTTPNACSSEEARVDNLIRMLRRIGVKQLSAHEVIKNHILPSISDEKSSTKDATLMIEYLSFVMIHLQSTCPNCQVERSDIISNLQKKSILLTNHGFKCPIKEPIHFGKEFGNSIDAKKLIDGMGIVWHEVDVIYLKHPSSQSPLFGLMKWREFFQELGVTDFVQVIHAEKNVADVLNTGLRGMPCVGDLITSKLVVEDWESPELVELLSTLSAKRVLQKSRYLLEVLDNLWDDYFSTKVEGYSFLQNEEYKNSFKSSLMKSIHDSKWVASSIGEEVHYPKDLFYDCESVRSILGDFAPYAVPKVMNKKCLDDMGFKVQVTLDDALKVMQSWKNFENPRASISQMSKFYSFIWNELATSMGKISEVKSSLSLFIPWDYASNYMDVMPGKFMPLHEVYWHEPTGCVDRMRETILQHSSTSKTKPPACITLATLYPELHDFFVNACGMLEVPPFGKYLHILLQLSSAASPSEAAHEVFEVLLKWASDLKSGQVKSEEILELKESLHKLENTVLPTKQGKWVSLHPSYGLICWSDDEELMEQYMHFDDVHFLEFGELIAREKELFSGKVAALMQNIGIPALSEVVSREAIFYGRAGTTEKALLVNWVLPYVQRYIYKLHPDIYFHLKQFEFRKISELQVIEVERLYYKNTLKGHPATNSKRIECSCLLQGNILYANHSAESHSLFLELSRFFFHGIPELQMANFLHMITIKAELDSSNEHLESFIINSQKLLEIPNGEPIWSLSSLNALNENNIYGPTSAASMTMRYQYPNLINSPVTGSSWPPKNLKSAPDIQSASRVMQSEELSDELVDNDFQVEDDPRTTVLNKESSASLEPSINLPAPEQRLIHATKVDDWDSLCLGIPNDNQLYETGRLGEIIAYKYFTKKLDSTMVKWVNEESEMGLPYDLIIGEEENREYVEVKATSSTSKDWFPISVNEWHYATEKGDSFSIARVVLSSPTNAKVLVLKNPLKLCQENVLQLAVLVPYSIENSTA